MALSGTLREFASPPKFPECCLEYKQFKWHRKTCESPSLFLWISCVVGNMQVNKTTCCGLQKITWTLLKRMWRRGLLHGSGLAARWLDWEAKICNDLDSVMVSKSQLLERSVQHSQITGRPWSIDQAFVDWIVRYFYIITHRTIYIFIAAWWSQRPAD